MRRPRCSEGPGQAEGGVGCAYGARLMGLHLEKPLYLNFLIHKVGHSPTFLPEVLEGFREVRWFCATFQQ